MKKIPSSSEIKVDMTKIHVCQDVEISHVNLENSDNHVFQPVDNTSSYVISAFHDQRIHKKKGIDQDIWNNS